MLFPSILLLILCVFVISICEANVADDLTKRYNDQSMKCVGSDKKDRPAYECSGLLIRGYRLNHPERVVAWSLKPGNREKTSVAFGFLRKDVPFKRFPGDYGYGFILYPHMKTPKNKNKQKVYCAFPVDAHTDDRSGRHGCGKSNTEKLGKSGHCDTQGITTYEKWLSHYEAIMKSPVTKNFVIEQCAFDMTTKTAARDFAVALKATSHFQDASNPYAFRNNELLLQSWDENLAKQIPIQAFFFIHGNRVAHKMAYLNQCFYRKASGGETIPIVAIRLPTEQNPNIYIEYIQHNI